MHETPARVPPSGEGAVAIVQLLPSHDSTRVWTPVVRLDEPTAVDNVTGATNAAEGQRIGEPVAADSFGGAVVVLGHYRVRAGAESKVPASPRGEIDHANIIGATDQRHRRDG